MGAKTPLYFQHSHRELRPYDCRRAQKEIKTTLKAKTDADAWATLYSDISRPFPKPVEIRQHAAGLTALL